MAIFSDGGFTSPDVWIGSTSILLALISLFLNPVVFRHNLLKNRSISRDLHLSLSTADFISSLIIPVTLSFGALRPKEQQCFQDRNTTFCQENYFRYFRQATIPEKLLGCVVWWLIFSPMCITSVLAISRWFCISFPFRILDKNKVEAFLVTSGIFLAVYFPCILFCDSPQYPTIIGMTLQIATSTNITYAKLLISLIFLQNLLSTIASCHTIWNLVKPKSARGNVAAQSIRKRSTVRITLLNAGNLVYIGAMIGVSMTERNSTTDLVMTLVNSFIPMLQSAYNAVIYVSLTKGILSKTSRVEAQS